MTNNEKKDKIQQEALSAWVKANKRATCEIVTGLGKTFIGLHALYTMPKNKDVHLFLAEARDREADLLADILKYNKIFKRDVLRDYNLKFYCYQTARNWKDKEFGLVICDEIHDSLTPVNSRFYRYNMYKAVIGLSATVALDTAYTMPSGKIITKADYLNKVAPICYSYSPKEAKEDKTSRQLNVYIIPHTLDMESKHIAAGNAKKRFYQTEYSAYTYWEKRQKKAFFIQNMEDRDKLMLVCMSKKNKIIYDSKAKIDIVKQLLDNLTTKTIIFGNSIDALLKITPNVVSSRNDESENKRIRKAFDKGLINRIGSFKKLKQGANLIELDNAIIMSYYSTSKDLIQRIGRLRDNGKIGNIFILVANNTQEEVWFSKMIESINNFNIIYCQDITHCIKKIKK